MLTLDEYLKVIDRNELKNYLNRLLDCDNFKDYAPNGLQVEGAQKICKICTAVTASADVIQQAVDWGADTLLVHHGYFWRGEEPVITGIKRQRIALLINNDINLFGYHLPLDCHKEFGNNAQLARLLNVDTFRTHSAGGTENLLWSGLLPESVNGKEFCKFLTEKFNRKPLHISANDRLIKRIAWCSGAAQDFIEEAASLGADAYISGEISERTYYQAQELGIHYFSCGHHATERQGIQHLGNHLAASYELEHLYIDSNNPV